MSHDKPNPESSIGERFRAEFEKPAEPCTCLLCVSRRLLASGQVVLVTSEVIRVTTFKPPEGQS